MCSHINYHQQKACYNTLFVVLGLNNQYLQYKNSKAGVGKTSALLFKIVKIIHQTIYKSIIFCIFAKYF